MELKCDIFRGNGITGERLYWCNLTGESCRFLSSVLSSNSSSLRELNLNVNKLQDSGVKLLSAGLKNPHCTLEILRLERCSITGEGCAALVSALRSNTSSHLKELHLKHNKPGESGVKLLSDLLKDPHCKLETLHLHFMLFYRELQSGIYCTGQRLLKIDLILLQLSHGLRSAANLERLDLEHKVITLLQNELKRYKKLLSPDYPACSEREVEDEEDQSSVREGVLKITLHFLKNMKHTDLANTLQNKLVSVYQRKKLKSKLREKCKRITEGISQHGSSALLNEIYTDLYITEGWSGDVNNEHEVRQIETVSRRPAIQETPIKCNDLFKDKSIRSVLTKGVAGIGKTVSVQKFILDWAEGKANQDVTFMFPLPFRELNLMKQKHLSLMDLLHHFFPEIKELRLIDCERNKVVLIFDGLDECRLPLHFQNNERLCDVTESVSVDVLLMNLIKGILFPSALLWITSRPGAANQIPPECVDQIKHKDQKYHQKCDPDPQQTRESILALGKLAFQQLEKGNLIFYEEDLRECGIDVSEMSVYSGVCTQIFREEFGLHLGKVFSFVHLSVQEFLAALYTFLLFINKKSKKQQINNQSDLFTKSNMSDFLRCAVDKALQSENGHLDLFLRFLLGLSLKSNQTLLRDLLPQTGSSSHSKQETVEYIKKKIRENPSPEKSINLFHCLNELNDDSLVQEVQCYLNSRDYRCLSGVKLSPAQWSALAFVLLNSEENLDDFNLSKYYPSDECLLRLLPVVKASRKAE
ncbi:NACHT, LRR and PYD domains-containing protein 12 isoform X3 [Silurus meridionalis]|nr:NACHT, LRR and PYD domains-containing protein 12 isoform X3 [Silurus meridionalis]